MTNQARSILKFAAILDIIVACVLMVLVYNEILPIPLFIPFLFLIGGGVLLVYSQAGMPE